MKNSVPCDKQAHTMPSLTSICFGITCNAPPPPQKKILFVLLFYFQGTALLFDGKPCGEAIWNDSHFSHSTAIISFSVKAGFRVSFSTTKQKVCLIINAVNIKAHRLSRTVVSPGPNDAKGLVIGSKVSPFDLCNHLFAHVTCKNWRLSLHSIRHRKIDRKNSRSRVCICRMSHLKSVHHFMVSMQPTWCS